MRILVLGGTRFVGKHLVEAARARGHAVTLFHRGQTRPGLFPDVETRFGDREKDLALLDGETWDAVIDTCAYVPRVARMAAERLKDAVSRYVFISSISVYGTEVPSGADETAPVLPLENPESEVVDGKTYGPLKACCEAVLEAIMPGRVLTIRPGIIVGPDDPTDRFTYWPIRIKQGGEVLAPGDPEQPIQVIDGRDLAAWIIRLIEAGTTGIFNATGPASPLSMRRFLETCQKALDAEGSLTWVSEEFLLARDVTPYAEVPLWIPRASAGFHAISSRKAQEAGLTYRSLTETIRDTVAWRESLAEPLKVGLNPERERELLSSWTSETERRPR